MLNIIAFFLVAHARQLPLCTTYLGGKIFALPSSSRNNKLQGDIIICSFQNMKFVQNE